MSSDALFKVLHELADIVEVFSQGIKGGYKAFRCLNPLTLLSISITLTVIAAYSSSDMVRVVILMLCLIQMLLMGSRRIMINALKTYAFIAILAMFLGLPSIYIHMDKYSVAISIIRTVFIAISSSSPMIVFSILIGLKEIGMIISVFSKTIGRAISMFSIMLLKVSRLQVDVLLMRFSRNLISRRAYIWRILISSVGDTLIHSEYITQSVALAIKSRTLSLSSLERRNTLKLLDYIVIALIAFIAILVIR